MKEAKHWSLTGEQITTSPQKYYEFQEAVYNYKLIREFPLTGIITFERFLPLLPVEQIRVSLPGRLGDTPVSKLGKFSRVCGFANLWVKHEECNPTGCFKDRESAVVISAALEYGAKKVVIASSGNAALSTAAYAQKAGIECICYVPEKTTEEKKALIKLFGAKLVEVPGFFEDVYRYIVDTNPSGWNVTTGQNPIRAEGNKTIAYEIYEQLGVPDVIIVPCGNGGCLAAIWKGFCELKFLGKINRLPQMVAVQIKGAAPLQIALQQKCNLVVLSDIQNSIAEGIVAKESYSSPKAIRALMDSGGYVVEVTDQEVANALHAIIRSESFVPEPTSATVYAALPKLKETNPESLVVAINTGSGMRMLPEIWEIVKKTHLID